MYQDFVDELLGRGRYYFTFEEISSRVTVAPESVRMALWRLIKKGVLALPYRQFYLIIPPEHRLRGCLPPQQFIPDLMKYLNEDYYVGLLSAAEFHGAAHHRPQVFQVVVRKPRRPLLCGKVKVQFITKTTVSDSATETRNTATGVVKISSPEVTAFDMVCHIRHCAGLDNVATVLSELVEKIDVNRLLQAAKCSPISSIQRLGYLLDLIGASEKSDVLTQCLIGRGPTPIALLPGGDINDAPKDNRWLVLVNAEVEADV